MPRILTPGVFQQKVLIVSSDVRQTEIGRILCVPANHYCEDLEAVRAVLGDIKAERFASSADFIGHCDGTAISIGTWAIGGHEGGSNGFRQLARILRKKRITTVRLLGCVTATVPDLLTSVDNALNPAGADEIVVWGTTVPLNEEHFDSAGLRCRQSGALRRAPAQSINGRTLFRRVAAARWDAEMFRMRNGSLKWQVTRISYQSARRFVEALPVEGATSTVAADFLVRPDVQYVFCTHRVADCQCAETRSFSLVLRGKGILYYGPEKNVLILLARRVNRSPELA